MGSIQDVMRTVILREEKRAFLFKVLIALIGYSGATWWLNAIRQTAPLWLVWVLIAAQFFCLIWFFVSCSIRARQCGFRHRWLLPVAFVLSRVDNWEIVILPLVAILVLLLSWSNKRVSEEHAYLIEDDEDPTTPPLPDQSA